MSKINISTLLKNIRIDRDYTQKDISNVLNLSRQGYARYEQGSCSPSIDMLEKLSAFYNIPLDYFIGYYNTSAPSLSSINDISSYQYNNSSTNVAIDEVNKLVVDYCRLTPDERNDVQLYISHKFNLRHRI